MVTFISSHWYVAVICHAGLFEATSSSTSLLDTSVVVTGSSETSGDIISGILDDTTSLTATAHSSTVTVQVRVCS